MKTTSISGYSMNTITYVFQAQSNCQAITICQGNTLDSQGPLTPGHLLLPYSEAGPGNWAAQLALICSDPRLRRQVSLAARRERPGEAEAAARAAASAPPRLVSAAAAGVLFQGEGGPAQVRGDSWTTDY